MKKRLIALVLAIVCSTVLFAGCGTEPETATNVDVSYVIPDLDGTQLKIYTPTNSDNDIEGSYLDTTVEQYLNADLVFTETDGLTSAVRQMVNEGTPPDVVFLTGYTHKSWGEFGAEYEAFVNILDCLDSLPNLKAYIEDPANKEVVEKFTYSPGKMYAMPVAKSGSAAIYSYLYRQDIFEKHGLTFPTNQEEFVAVLRKLKELYPDSEPFVMRSMKKNIQAAQIYGHLWGASHLTQTSSGVTFTLDAEGNYYLAAVSEPYKELAIFWRELMDEGLMSKSSLTLGTEGWYQAFQENKSFITYDKVDRLPLMNESGQLVNADFQAVAGAPFNMGSYAEKSDVVSTSFAEGITTNCFMIGFNENMGESLAYVDWLYSPDGSQMTSWGKEGESYEVAKDGTKSFKEGFIEEQGGWAATGFGTSGSFGIFDFNAYKAGCEPYLAESITLAEQFVGKSPKQPLLSFNEDEQLMYVTYGSSMYNYVVGEWYKFVSGDRDIAEWDQVLERAKKYYGYDILLEIHQSAYERVKEEEQ